MRFVNELCTFLFIATGRFVHSHQRCYACSNIDSSKILADLQDRNWREWLSSANREPHGLTDECLDEFTPEVAIRSGARSTSCQNGTCLKLTINEFRGPSYVWRSCIPDSASYVRSDCTKVNTKSGELQLCTCFGNLCNSALAKTRIHWLFVFVLFFIPFYCLNR